MMAMPEPPKVAMDDMAEEEPAEGESWKDGLSWMVMASAFYRVGGYTSDGVVAGPYNVIGYPYTNYNGFGLNFAGGDLHVHGREVRGSFGPPLWRGRRPVEPDRPDQAGLRELGCRATR